MRVLLLRVLFAVYLVLVGVVVWTPSPDAEGLAGLIATVSRAVGLPFEASYTVLEFGANIAMFVPFGMLAMVAFAWTRVWSATLAGLVTSGIIEGVQLLLPGRYSTVSDLVANTTGALIGALAIALWRRRHRTR